MKIASLATSLISLETVLNAPPTIKVQIFHFHFHFQLTAFRRSGPHPAPVFAVRLGLLCWAKSGRLGQSSRSDDAVSMLVCRINSSNACAIASGCLPIDLLFPSMPIHAPPRSCFTEDDQLHCISAANHHCFHHCSDIMLRRNIPKVLDDDDAVLQP